MGPVSVNREGRRKKKKEEKEETEEDEGGSVKGPIPKIRKLSCHVDTVTCIVECFGYICTGSYDGTVVVWDKATGEKVKILRFSLRSRILTMRPWRGMLAVGNTGREEISLWTADYKRYSLKANSPIGSILCFQEWNDLLWSGSDSFNEEIR